MRDFIMNTEDIKKILPHREPFLFVDQIREMKDDFIVCVKTWSASEPFF